MLLNERAQWLATALRQAADDLRVGVASCGGATVIDAGCRASGGLEAGRKLAEICLAGLAEVSLLAPDAALGPEPLVGVRCDHPWRACLAAQYAGWRLQADDYFAMVSGPIRAAGSAEPLVDQLACRESPSAAVGVLEADQLPTAAAVAKLAAACRLPAEALTLLVAPTHSLAGGLQVAARSLETCLHKLHELGFDVRRIAAGAGWAPLPPPAHNSLAAIGRTNDAILYGGRVVLYLHGDDDELTSLGPRVPSSSSRDFGRPFGELFQQYEYDFYRVDPLLFSPAQATLVNLASGRQQTFGQLRPDVLRRSFDG